MDFGFLRDLVVVFGLGGVVVLVFSRLRVPPLVGFLLTGVLVGPHGFALIEDHYDVDALSEVGIVVLLFSIGLEFSLSQLLRMGRIVFLGGALQVVATTIAAAGAAFATGLDGGASVLIGFIAALSSTAIAMRLLAEKAQTTTPHGRVSLGILIFQDLAVVPMVLAVPYLAAGSAGAWGMVSTLAKATAVVVVVLIVSRTVVPRLLQLVVGTRSRELFVFALIVICLGTALMTSWVGLSLALGAFLAGITMSESEYSHHAMGTILPFRDAFSSLFFVSIGMLLDPFDVLGRPLTVLGALAALLLVKALIAGSVVRALGYNVRTAAHCGLLLCQVGEFAFLLLHEGGQAGLLDESVRQLVVAVSVLSMAATPLLFLAAPRIAAWLTRSALPPVDVPEGDRLADHVVIVGYGVNGQNVARALRGVGMPYVILEMNPQTVRRLRQAGEPITYADATHPDALKHAGIDRARVLVVTIPEASSARRIVRTAHEINPAVRVIVRTAFVTEVKGLYDTGANEVIPEEFETSIEIFCRVLRHYMVPRDVVDRLVRETRREGYEMFRAGEEGVRRLESLPLHLPQVELEVFQVEERSPICGLTLRECELHQRTGALAIAVRRGDATRENPGADWRLEAGDAVVLLGPPHALSAAVGLLRAPA